MTALDVLEIMGGPGVAETEVRSDLDLARAIHLGIAPRAVDEVVEAGLLSPTEVYALVIPRRTLAHRKARRQRLTADESDRLTRVVRAVGRAGEALGSDERAARWLRQPNRALDGHAPLALLDSDVGARTVERVLGRVEHGVFS